MQQICLKTHAYRELNESFPVNVFSFKFGTNLLSRLYQLKM